MSGFAPPPNNPDGRVFASYPMPAKIDLLNERPRRESLVEKELENKINSIVIPKINTSEQKQFETTASYQHQARPISQQTEQNQNVNHYKQLIITNMAPVIKGNSSQTNSYSSFNTNQQQQYSTINNNQQQQQQMVHQQQQQYLQNQNQQQQQQQHYLQQQQQQQQHYLQKQQQQQQQYLQKQQQQYSQNQQPQSMQHNLLSTSPTNQVQRTTTTTTVTTTNNSYVQQKEQRAANNAAILAQELAEKEAKLMAEINSLHQRPYSPYQVPDKIDLTSEHSIIQQQYQNAPPSSRPQSAASSTRSTSVAADLLDKEAKLLQQIEEMEKKPYNPQTMVVEREQWFEYPEGRPHDRHLTDSKRRVKDFCSLPSHMYQDGGRHIHEENLPTTSRQSSVSPGSIHTTIIRSPKREIDNRSPLPIAFDNFSTKGVRGNIASIGATEPDRPRPPIYPIIKRTPSPSV